MKAAPRSLQSKTVWAIEICSGVEEKKVRSVLNALGQITVQHLKRYGRFAVPGVATIKSVMRPAREARLMSAFGKIVEVKAKPAATGVKCFAHKSFREQTVSVQLRGKSRQVRYCDAESMAAIVEASGVGKKKVRSVIGALHKVTVQQVKLHGKFAVPGMVVIKSQRVPARPSRMVKCFGKTVRVGARPRRTVLKYSVRGSFAKQLE